MFAVLDNDESRVMKDHCERRAKALMGNRSDIDALNYEVASLTQPMRSRFNAGTDRRRRSRTNKLNDGYGGQAAEILANGMTSGLSSSARPWARLRTPDEDLMKFQPVREWLDNAQATMFAFMAATGFYETSKAGYLELGLFGTEAGFLEEHWQSGMVCHGLTWGEYSIGLGDDMRPDTLTRQVPLTTWQAVQRFVASKYDRREMDWTRVSPAVKDAWDNSNYQRSFDFLHLVEPNPVWDPVRLDFRGKRWRSLYWQPNETAVSGLADWGGMEEKPFWAARWAASSGDPYGSSPGHYALADLRDLQVQRKRKGDATDLAIKPPMVAPAGVKLKMTPGSITHASLADKDSITPAWQVDYRAIETVGKDLDSVRRTVGSYFYVDLFMAISRMEGVQPRNEQEIWSREEEKLAQLGPTIDRVNVEKLAVAVDRVFGICLRRGMFAPPPEELHNVELETEFVSILAQAQRALGLSSVERSIGFVGNVAGTFPDVTDNIDADEVVLDYLDRTGFPAVGIRDPQDRDALRKQRAQDAAAEKTAAMMAPMKDGAQAAELLSRTDLRGKPILDTLTGQ